MRGTSGFRNPNVTYVDEVAAERKTPPWLSGVYTLSLPDFGNPVGEMRPHQLTFDNVVEVKGVGDSDVRGDLDGTEYFLNGRQYLDYGTCRWKEKEKITDRIRICSDKYGAPTIEIFTKLKAVDFDQLDWESRQYEYLMTDGRYVHLIRCRRGREWIRSVTVFYHLLEAPAELKPWMEKAGLMTDGITFAQGRGDCGF